MSTLWGDPMRLEPLHPETCTCGKPATTRAVDNGGTQRGIYCDTCGPRFILIDRAVTMEARARYEMAEIGDRVEWSGMDSGRIIDIAPEFVSVIGGRTLPNAFGWEVVRLPDKETCA